MKKNLVIIGMITTLVAVWFYFYSRKENEPNFRIAKAIALSEQAKINPSLSSVMYLNRCPDGLLGCSATPTAPQCDESGTHENCNVPSRPQFRQTGICPNHPGVVVCQLSIITSFPACGAASSCPGDPTQPTKHPAPCNYGTMPFGCYNGWNGGPSCSTLVDCPPPPL